MIARQTFAAHLVHQRWFGGKGRRFEVVDVTRLPWIDPLPEDEPGPPARVELVTVRFSEGDVETYQLPLVYREAPVEQLSHALIAELDDDDSVDGAPGHWHVYDALHDKEVTGRWLSGVVADRELGEGASAMVFRREPSATDIPLDEHSIVVGAEQSNTSLIFGDRVILKIFRKVSHGQNPDIEIHAALAEAGNTSIAPLLGWVDGTWTSAAGQEGAGSLAMLQVYLRSASEGWELAKASVRDLYAEADLHADEVGGDFASEALRLGVATAAVHNDLANALPTSSLGAEETAKLVAAMRARLEAAVGAVPALAEYAAGLRGAYDDLANHEEPIAVQRIHGDFHLGQTMRTLEGWRLLDFEGEPAKPLEERRALDSPLRDVAGMLRSFDYAARHLLADRPGDVQLEYRAREWWERNRAAFCDGYARRGGYDPASDPVLLRAYETDKAVYEAVYEARNRPSWLPIPMAAIRRLAAPPVAPASRAATPEAKEGP